MKKQTSHNQGSKWIYSWEQAQKKQSSVIDPEFGRIQPQKKEAKK